MAKKAPAVSAIIPAERIQQCIYVIRGQKVLLDEDLARLYGVQTRVLNQAVSRNVDRFPEDYVFRLTAEEFANLKSQIVTSSWGGRRKPPRAFTEQGHDEQIKQLFLILRQMLDPPKEPPAKFGFHSRKRD